MKYGTFEEDTSFHLSKQLIDMYIRKKISRGNKICESLKRLKTAAAGIASCVCTARHPTLSKPPSSLQHPTPSTPRDRLKYIQTELLTWIL